MAIETRDMTTTDETTGLFAELNRKELLKALTATKATTPTRAYLPILTSARLTARYGTLEVLTTNLDAAISVELPALAQPTDGTCMAEHKQFLAAVKALKSETVELRHAGKVLNVRGGVQVIPVSAQSSVEDFPVIASEFAGQSFMLDSAELATIAASTAPYAATDDTRPILTGALFTVNADTLEVAACDGFALSTRKAYDMTGDDGAFILPASTLKLCKFLPVSLAYVALNANRSQCEIQSANVRIVSRLIEGSYPNVKQIIPTKFEGCFTVKRADLAAILPMVLPVAKDNSNAITLTLDYSTLHVSACDTDGRTVDVTVAVENHMDMPSVQFNGDFIKRTVESMDADLIEWKVSGKNSAAVVRPVIGADHTVVIMPMHTGSR